MTAIKNRSTDQGRKFWDHVERISDAVKAKQKSCDYPHVKGEHCPVCGWIGNDGKGISSPAASKPQDAGKDES